MVNVNQDECVGCSACSEANPEVFEMVEGKAKVKAGQEGNDAGKETIDVCPVGAIKE